MSRMKIAVVVASLVLLFMLSVMISPTKAVISGDNLWYEYRHSYKLYGDNPESISTSSFAASPDYSWWINIGLVASVYEYTQFFGDDSVNFRLALYFDSYASENMPVPIPVAADFVTFFIDKDTGGSDLTSQTINIVNYDTEGFGPGYSQGYGFVQTTSTSSTYDNRALWAWDAIAFAIGLFSGDPAFVISTAIQLISLGVAWVPQGGVDYDNAAASETRAKSWWHNPGYDFGLQNPVRQYAFNSIQWIQDSDVNPSTYYGLKVWARVGLVYPNPLDCLYIDTSPVYLRIYPNQKPNTPSRPSGPTSGYEYTSYSYSTSTTDPDGDSVRYQFDWGDGSTSTTGLYASGTTVSSSHSWSSTGTFYIKVRAKDFHDVWSDWSTALSVTISSDSGGSGGGGGWPPPRACAW